MRLPDADDSDEEVFADISAEETHRLPDADDSDGDAFGSHRLPDTDDSDEEIFGAVRRGGEQSLQRLAGADDSDGEMEFEQGTKRRAKRLSKKPVVFKEEEWRMFTPSSIGQSCLARTFHGGLGGQCQLPRVVGRGLCQVHAEEERARGLKYGLVTGTIPPAGMQIFVDRREKDEKLKAAAASEGPVSRRRVKSHWYTRRHMWLSAVKLYGSNFTCLEDLDDSQVSGALLRTDEYFKNERGRKQILNLSLIHI